MGTSFFICNCYRDHLMPNNYNGAAPSTLKRFENKNDFL